MKLKLSFIILIVYQLSYGQTVDTVVFPDDFQTTADYMAKKDRVLYFDQTLVVSDNSQWQKYGELKLSSLRLFNPTDMARPNSSDYQDIISENAKNWIYIDDGSSQTNPTPLPFSSADGTRRIGSRINNLKATLRQYSWGWALVPVDDLASLQFYGNERPASVEFDTNYNLKVASFNLEYYLYSNYGTGYGPDNYEEAARQHSKILKAIMAIDADIYGLIEIQQGQQALQKLCFAMNEEKGEEVFDFINDGGSAYGSYTKVGFIYRKDKVQPFGSLKNINTVVQHRKKLQGFQMKSNGEKFILSLNHFKSKTGSNASGNNADLGDGQGKFNGDRIREAQAVISAMPAYISSVGDDDVLVVGDLNAYSEEDPLEVFYQNNFINMLKNESPESYSYLYQGLSGCLDHALASPTMAQQIADVEVFHINADEPSMFEYSEPTYQDNMYRCSDHDAVVVALNLGITNGIANTNNNKNFVEIISTNEFKIKDAEGKWLSVFSSAGMQILHKQIQSNEEIIKIDKDGVGVFFIYIDGANDRFPQMQKVIF